MKYLSTRRQAPAVSISQAIRQGTAPDGGLYMPAGKVRIDHAALSAGMSLAELAARILTPFFDGDPLAWHLPAICEEAFDFPAPLVAPDPNRPGLRALELFHGPTGAFKDFGARFLIRALDRREDQDRPLTILVATSGDTGGAVGAAAEGRTSLRTFILYPRGRVSAFQARQLGCWVAPVQALEVEGDFDDCQRLVKAAFADPDLVEEFGLTSANSINIGRLLPQMAYFAHAALQFAKETGVAPGFVVPTGNMGHIVAALMTRAIGLPIGPLVASTNVNATLKDWAVTKVYRPRPSVATIANAMDVGAPSNFERFAFMPADQREVRVVRVSDEAIRARIAQEHERCGYVWCPHSATAVEAYHRLSDAARCERTWIVASTAHPYKFADVVEPLIRRAMAPPPALAAINGVKSQATSVETDLSVLKAILRNC